MTPSQNISKNSQKPHIKLHKTLKKPSKTFKKLKKQKTQKPDT
jgi:hypothetical protein